MSVSCVLSTFKTTYEYWRGLVWFWRGNSFTSCPYFRETENRQARVQVCALALVFYLWDKPHYRDSSFSADLRQNLKNVAVPGTGLPLSFFCFFKPLGIFLVFILNPFFCFMGAINVARKQRTGTFFESLSAAYRRHLFFPDDWFSYWRLNCALASWYWLVTKESGYDLENKWTFLQRAREKGVPCSPCLDMKGLCIKHKNMEGGLGIHFFQNALDGGDWIIQETMKNHSSVACFLPRNAPLSTFRVMTGSRLGIASTGSAAHSVDREASKKGVPAETASSKLDPVFAFSCVFRAGRAGGLTDHNSVLFNVDVPAKKLGLGTSNMHWYQLGLRKILSTPWLNNTKFTHHPDGDVPVTDRELPEMAKMIETCVEAHRTLFPGVPIAGWDLAVVDGEPHMCLLEVNLMCNFFKGSFDKDKYFRFVEDYFLFCEGHQEK